MVPCLPFFSSLTSSTVLLLSSLILVLATLAWVADQTSPGQVSSPANPNNLKRHGVLLTADIVLEPSGSAYLGHDLGHYGSDPSMTPPSAPRSMTGSPPRPSLAPEQRELKRQRDMARRDSKVSQRIRRAGSNSSSQGGYEVSSPPSDLASTTSLPSMPVYTTAPAELSLLTEPTTLAPQLVMGHGSYSPPLPSSSSQSMFPTPYQQQQPYMDYSAYPTTTGASMPSHYG